MHHQRQKMTNFKTNIWSMRDQSGAIHLDPSSSSGMRSLNASKKRASLGLIPSNLAILIYFVSMIVCLALIVAVQQQQTVNASHSEEHEQKHKYNPYKYGYKVIDHKGNKQWKQEESHNPMEVKGSYGYKDKHGLFREVSYVADKHGFRAHVKTNEPGTAPKNPAAVKMDAHPNPTLHKKHH